MDSGLIVVAVMYVVAVAGSVALAIYYYDKWRSIQRLLRACRNYRKAISRNSGIQDAADAVLKEAVRIEENDVEES